MQWNVEWKIPFNGDVRKVLLDKIRLIGFWSKNPRPMLDRIEKIGSQLKGYTEKLVSDSSTLLHIAKYKRILRG